MLNPNHPVTERLLGVLLLPMLLGMGMWGRICVCLHDEAPGAEACHSEVSLLEAALEQDCASETDCDADDSCCCFDELPMELSQLAEASSTITQSDPRQQLTINLAVPAQGSFASAEGQSSVPAQARASAVPWPEQRPLFVLFESYLC